MATGKHRNRDETSHTNQALKEPWKPLKWLLGCDSLTQQYYVLLACPWYNRLLQYSRSTPRLFFHVSFLCSENKPSVNFMYDSAAIFLNYAALYASCSTISSASTRISQRMHSAAIIKLYIRPQQATRRRHRPVWASSVTTSSEVWLTHTTVLHTVILLFLKLSKLLPLLLLLLLLILLVLAPTDQCYRSKHHDHYFPSKRRKALNQQCSVTSD